MGKKCYKAMINVNKLIKKTLSFIVCICCMVSLLSQSIVVGDALNLDDEMNIAGDGDAYAQSTIATVGDVTFLNDGNYQTVWSAQTSMAYAGIKLHNKYSIDSTIDERNMLFSKMIQDADKVDILESLSNKLIEFNDDDSKISDSVKDYFDSHKLLLSNLKETNNDRMISFLCFIYDLHFTWSYNYLYEHKIFDKIYNNLNNKEIFKYYFEKTNKYLQEKIGE